MSHVKRKHDNVYAPPTLRIQLQIWPIVPSITELTMHTELKCSKSLSLSVSLLFANFGCQQLRMRTCTHQYTGAHVLIGMHKLHIHTHGMHAHSHTYTHTGMHACMHTHTHTHKPGPGKHCRYGHLSPCGADNMETTSDGRKPAVCQEIRDHIQSARQESHLWQHTHTYTHTHTHTDMPTLCMHTHEHTHGGCSCVSDSIIFSKFGRFGDMLARIS